jgi:protein involved in polysaccharide export with SLBB domain
MVDHLERHNANIARAMHTLGAESTEAFEAARDKVATFIGAPEREGVVFTKNITEGLNLLANTFAWAEGDLRVGPGDVLRVNVWKHEEVSQQQATVRPDGAISMPLLGDVPAAGRSAGEISNDIATRLKQFFQDQPPVTVQVAEVKSYRIYVVGEV